MTRLRYDESAGDWQDGYGAVQVPCFEAIATMLERFGADGSVLDVGCGVAALRQWLPAESRYLGVEQSGAALKEGLRRDRSLAMVQEKAEKFDAAGELFDSIVFNEMLYDCANPVGLLRKFAGFLAPGGVIVCSIFSKAG